MKTKIEISEETRDQLLRMMVNHPLHRNSGEGFEQIIQRWVKREEQEIAGYPIEKLNTLCYSDFMDADEQISMEEQIAAIIFEGVEDMHEETATEFGRQILLLVLSRFRPDLLIEIK